MARTYCSLFVACTAIVHSTIADNSSLEPSSTAGATLQALDTDGSGSVEQAEILDFAKSVGLDSDEAINDFQSLDKNGNGALELAELTGSLFDFGGLSQDTEAETPNTVSLSDDRGAAAPAVQSSSVLRALPSEVSSKVESEAASLLSVAASAPAAPAAPAAQKTLQAAAPVAASTEPVASMPEPAKRAPPNKLSLMSVVSSSAASAATEARTTSISGLLPFEVASSPPSVQPQASAMSARAAPVAASLPKPAAPQSAVAVGPLTPQAAPAAALFENENWQAAKAPPSEVSSIPVQEPRKANAGVVPQWSGVASQSQLISASAQSRLFASTRGAENSGNVQDTKSKANDAAARRIAQLEAELAAARAANAAKMEPSTPPSQTVLADIASHADALISIGQHQHSWQNASAWLQESMQNAEHFSEKATAEAFSLRAEKVMAQERKDEADVAEFENLAASLHANASALAKTVKQQTQQAAREAIEKETKSALAKVQWLEDEAKRAEADAADRRAKAAEIMKQAAEVGAQLTENVRRLRVRRTSAAN